jgi:hypothetical protein
LDEIAFSQEEHSISSQRLNILGAINVGRSTLNLICQDIAIEQRFLAWKYIFVILGILSFALLAVASIYVVLTRYLLTLKSRIINILMCTLHEPILCLMQPPPTAQEPNQQPLLDLIH